MTVDRRTLILGASTLAALGAAGVGETESPEPNVSNPKERVQGIGGLFFRSRDPKALSEWYQLHLGIDPTPAEYNAPVWQQAAGPTVFAPFPADTKYFGSPQQAWMVNFRVRNLDAMVAQLRGSSIVVDVDAQASPIGRFARLHDPEGNPIELWEPADRQSAR
jgi:catechol 2,3-dioxygenase-like lactoylglutathione lyase family enzyme